MKLSHHAESRTKQRGIPEFAIDMLIRFGVRDYDHKGGVIRTFNKHSKTKMKKYLGADFYKKVAGFFESYVVESADDHTVITCGHRYNRIRRS